MRSRVSALLMLFLMLVAAGGAYGLRPTQRIADTAPPVDPEVMIPKAFGDWTEEPQWVTQIVDPQQQRMIDKIYSTTLQRTYVNSDGYQVMLSIAYGSDQSDSMQVHKPEVCYPAQGYVLHEMRDDELTTPYGVLPVTKIRASHGVRNEPITYWVTVGDRVVENGVQKKVVEIGYGLSGKIPDGMLIRVSSIDPETNRGYETQARFTRDLVAALPASSRQKLAGLGG